MSKVIDGSTQNPDSIRLGILGCASVSSFAIIDPVRRGARVTLAAVASRDELRAADYAREHGFAKSYGRYEDLLADPELDAVYIPLPNSLHRTWAIAAMQAGYPVLCEKPLAMNAEEAEEMARISDTTGSALIEAFHWRTHPQAERIMQILDEGIIGAPVELEMKFDVPAEWIAQDNIRYDRSLGGGALMDLGCYCIDLIRKVAKSDPVDVSASASITSGGVDSAMAAMITFDSGLVAKFSCSMASQAAMEQWVVIKGDKGVMRIQCPISPSYGGEIRVDAGQTSFAEAADQTPSWFFQANYFADVVLKRIQPRWNAWDAVDNMALIDRVRVAANLI
jgi:predicted dehydrogenase